MATFALVPRLSEFYGIAVYMYFVDHDPPHFHVVYAEHEAQVRISDGAIIGGWLPRVATRLIGQWGELHRSELMENWHRAQEPAALLQIDPLG
jgi:uncharacterized protein DUF4160